MADRIEPPILLSRLMTFVFAAALVVVVVLVVTLAKMFPLNRPQIFFLTTQPRSDLEIRLYPMTPRDENVDIYKRSFIKEYIKARNEIIPNVGVMRRKWSNTDDGIVNMWSTPDVDPDGFVDRVHERRARHGILLSGGICAQCHRAAFRRHLCGQFYVFLYK